MDRYHEMLMFEARSERPSLASAARRLVVSGPTVVRAIARLEARQGVTLLQRSTQGVVLTVAGSAFMADWSRILKAVEDAEASAKGPAQQLLCLPQQIAAGDRSNLYPLLPVMHRREWSSAGTAIHSTGRSCCARDLDDDVR